MKSLSSAFRQGAPVCPAEKAQFHFFYWRNSLDFSFDVICYINVKMAALSEKEQSGCRRLLELLSAEDLMALKDTVTNRLISVESTREAVEAIIAYSQSAEELLKRRKVHREVIFQYLAKEGVAVPPNTEKLHLVRRTLALWSDKVALFQDTQNNSTACCQEEPDGLGDLTALGKEFCRWFYQLFNSLNPTAGLPVQDWGPQHFWGDAKLFILSCTGEQEQDEYYGAELVSRRLSALVWEEKLIFCPNLEQSGLKCLSTPHGLVLVAVAGTIHRENLCLGIFEQVFGLIRDPLEGNRWKMKYVHLKIKGQVGGKQLPVLTYESDDMLQLFTT